MADYLLCSNFLLSFGMKTSFGQQFYLWLFLAITLLPIAKLMSQSDSLKYYINCSDCANSPFAKQLLKNESDTINSSILNSRLKSLRSSLYENGFLLPKLYQSGDCVSNLCKLELKIGKRFEWTMLQNGNIPPQLLKTLDYGAILLSDKPFNLKDLSKLQGKVLSNCENNGYPFAELWIDSISADTMGALRAKIFLDYGPKILIDSLQVIGKSTDGKELKVRISKKFLNNYLGLKKGAVYDESQILKISKRIKELPFLSSYKDPQILFKADKAYPILFLETKRASRFDVIFGLLPNTNPATQRQQFNFTGNVNIDLLNALGRGEKLLAQWQQFQQGRSELRLGVSFPYLFGSPLGIDSKFELYRRDSTYVDVITDIGLSYLFDGNNYLKIYWKNAATNVQSFNTESIISNRKIPSILDLRNNSFGIEYYFQRLNYRWNPLKGFELRIGGAVGFKYIKPNNSILSLRDPLDPGFDFATLYDSISTRSFQYSAQFSYAHFFRIWKQLTLMGRYRTAAVFNNKKLLYTNELLRIGGQQIMRGFDEQSIFSSWYQVATTELRYLLGTNSYTYLFGDLSYSQNISTNPKNQSWRYGFGLGLALDTKVGVFGLSYALGSEFGNPLLIRNGKIHFGYVNMF
jgi:outer membrane protein assembly factor BamA